MAKKDIAIILGGTLLSNYKTLNRLIEPNETDKVTLGGNLFTYHKNNRRIWKISWDLLKEEDFQVIYDLYIDQYNNNTYHTLQLDAYDVYVPVKMEIDNQNIKYNGSIIKGFTLTLKEQYAFS